MLLNSIGRKLSPTAPSRLTVDASLDKDEGISDEEDPAELRVLLDLNEQESSQLRRKVDELEQENKAIKGQLKELRDVPKTPTLASRQTILKDKEIVELKTKLADMEKEMKMLRKTATKTGTLTIQKLEEEKKKSAQEIDSFKSEISKSTQNDFSIEHFIRISSIFSLLFCCYFEINREFEERHCKARDTLHRFRKNKCGH